MAATRKALSFQRNHPSHLHPLVKTDLREVYPSYNAQWKCHACQREFDGQAYHCHLCQYNICAKCFQGELHPFHHHRLRRVRVELIYPKTDGRWKCDGCMRMHSRSTPSDRQCHHCSECKLSLCNTCFGEGWAHALHDRPGHRLKPVDARLVYRHYTGWDCDHCGASHTIGKNLQVLFHCSECGDVDLCMKCFLREEHPLQETTPRHALRPAYAQFSLGSSIVCFEDCSSSPNIDTAASISALSQQQQQTGSADEASNPLSFNCEYVGTEPLSLFELCLYTTQPVQETGAGNFFMNTY